MGSLWHWLASSANAPVVGALSLILSFFGIAATLLGLWFTFSEAKLAAKTARTTATELDALKDRIARHDAAKEVGQAIYALSIARSQVTGGKWDDVARRCDDAAQALMRINPGLLLSPDHVSGKVIQVRNKIGRTVDQIDAARAEKGPFPQEDKLMHALRRHAEILNGALLDLQKEAAQ